MFFDRDIVVNAGARYRKLLLAGTALAGAALFPSVVQAQAIWGGVGATTATSDYNTGTNWSTSIAPTAVLSAQFGDGTGGAGGTASTAVTVTAGPVTPSSWTFLANSKSYTVAGQAVNFVNAASLTNNASAGKAISIANNMSGTGLSQAAASTLTISGTNSFTTSSITGGTLINNGSLTSTVGVAAAGTFSNSSTVTGTVNNAGTFNNNAAGTVSGLLTNTAGTTTNAGQLNGGVAVSGGTVSNSNIVGGGVTVSGGGTYTQFAGTTSGGLTNGDIVNGLGGIFNGAIVNNAAGIFSVTGTISGNSTFTNNGTAELVVILGGNFTGITTLTNNSTDSAGVSITLNSALSAANISNSAGSTMLNAGTLTATAGPISNAGTLNNDVAGSIINGGLSNTAGVTNNTGTINGGVAVSGGTVSNSKIVGGGVTVSGTGTYTQTAGTTSGGLTNGNIVNANGGAINGAIANSATFKVGGTVTSDSTFNNSAAASVLHVTNGGIYTVTGLVTNSGTAAGGGILVDAGGRLIATAGGITNTVGATIINNGRIDDVLNNAGTVTNNLTYNADVATNTGTITNTATGTWTGNVTTNAGNATGITNSGIWIGNVLANTGTITNNKTWTGTVSNGGTFNNTAAGTVSGLLTNTAGTTTNDGILSAGATVNGGTLTGQGLIVGTTTVASGGTFTPGSGTPGTAMTLTGSLALQSGAFYMVQINPATSSLANVTGNATLGGATVKANFAAGSYIAKQYLILHTTTGVTGTFNPTVANTNLPSNFKTVLSYDPNGKDVELDLTLGFTPPSGSLSGNQQNVANAIVGFFNSTGSIPLVFSGLTPAGLTQISGEIATATQQTTFDSMNLFMGLLTDPFVAGRGDGISSSAGATPFAEEIDAANAYAAKDPARSKSEREAYAAIYRKAPVMAPFVPSWSVWAAGFGGSQTTSGNATVGSNDTTSRLGSIAVGADYRFSPNTLAGVALAGGGTSFSVVNGGTGRSDLFQAGAFVRHTVGAAYFTGALAYGWQDITTDRTVTIAGIDQLRARFNANAFSGRIEGGYRFATPWMGVTPYAAGQFTTFDLPAYAESVVSGANTFALAYGAKSVTATRSEIGLRTDKYWAMPDSVFTLRGRFAWAHDYNTDRAIGATFQTLPGASFVVNGAAQSADKALTTASAEVKWRSGVSLAATFEGEFSGNSTSYAGKGVARYQW